MISRVYAAGALPCESGREAAICICDADISIE